MHSIVKLLHRRKPENDSKNGDGASTPRKMSWLSLSRTKRETALKYKYGQEVTALKQEVEELKKEMAEKDTQMYMKDNKIRFLEWKMSKSQEDVKKIEETLREMRYEEELRKKRFEMIKENNIKLETKLNYLESTCKEKDVESAIIRTQTGNKAEESKKKPQELRADAEPWFPYKTYNPNISIPTQAAQNRLARLQQRLTHSSN